MKNFKEQLDTIKAEAIREILTIVGNSTVELPESQQVECTCCGEDDWLGFLHIQTVNSNGCTGTYETIDEHYDDTPISFEEMHPHELAQLYVNLIATSN